MAKNAKADAAAESGASVALHPLKIERVEIPIIGETELIVHAWSEKSRRQMLDKQMNPGARAKRGAKDPLADYESSMYRLTDGTPAFPASALKAAIVGACRLFSGLPMTQAKIAIRVLGELLPIEGEPRMREDMVRLENGVADIRYRAGFSEWKMMLPISFNASTLSLESLVNLVDGAGQGGIGEWRPSAPKSASGSFGTFRVDVERMNK